jgi:hypothetical protein
MDGLSFRDFSIATAGGNARTRNNHRSKWDFESQLTIEHANVVLLKVKLSMTREE